MSLSSVVLLQYLLLAWCRTTRLNQEHAQGSRHEREALHSEDVATRERETVGAVIGMIWRWLPYHTLNVNIWSPSIL
jgi:hypothetical protein